jgi:hypothetical protein
VDGLDEATIELVDILRKAEGRHAADDHSVLDTVPYGIVDDDAMDLDELL